MCPDDLESRKRQSIQKNNFLYLCVLLQNKAPRKELNNNENNIFWKKDGQATLAHKKNIFPLLLPLKRADYFCAQKS